MNAVGRSFPVFRWLAVLVVCLVGLAAARSTSAAVGPLPVTGVVGVGKSTVGVGPGVAVIVCHVTVGAEVLGVPLVVQAGEISAFLASNPRDYVGECKKSGGAVTPGAVEGGEAAEAALGGLAESVLVVVCAKGDGQLLLTPDAAAALVRTDADVALGRCAATRDGQGQSSSSDGTGKTGSTGTADGASGTRLVNGRVSVPARSLSCGDRLIVTRVATTPGVVRAKLAKITARFVVVNDRGLVVRGANVWLRSAPRDYINASARKTTAADGSVRFALTTSKRLPLRAGGRLVLFARATLPGQPTIGCVTGRRLISIRVSTPQS